MTRDSVRSMLAGTAFAGLAIALSGCGADPQGGYQRTYQGSGSPEGMSYREAHAQCWETSMNIGGNAATAAQERAYNACMARNGWSDPRMPR